MSRFSDNLRDQYDRPISGALVYVYNTDETLAALTADGGGSLENPVKTDEFGNYSFNTIDAFYDLRFVVDGKIVLERHGVAVGDAFRLLEDAVARADDHADRSAVYASQALSAVTNGGYFYDRDNVRFEYRVINGKVLPAFAPHFFTDNQRGSDANNGLTLSTAKKTLSGGSGLLTTGTGLGIVAGSPWREALTTATVDIALGGYGSTLPIIDGASVVTGWTAHATQANVWEKTGWTHDGFNTDRLTIYENGALLTRVATLADCGTTPGSFLDVKSTDGATVTLRIHATNSGNPNTNGKTYEASQRRDVILVTGANAGIDGLHTRRQIGNNGSLVVSAPGASIRRVLASYGTKHNFYMASGVASDCIAFGADPTTSYESSSIMFISYMGDTTGETYTYNRCGAISPLAVDANLISAFGAHSNDPGILYASATIRQCWVSGWIYAGYPAGGAATAVVEGLHTEARDCGLGNGLIRYSTGRWVPKATTSTGTSVNFGTRQDIITGTIQHCAYRVHNGWAVSNFASFLALRNGTVADCRIENTAFSMQESGSFTPLLASATATSGTLRFNRNIVFGFGVGVDIPTGVSYVANNNVFMSGATDRHFYGIRAGVEYTTLSTWQTATGQDSNSVYLDKADQVAGGANAFWLAYKNAAAGTNLTTIGPDVGDFRINPNARVYAGNATAYIGTFPDGTAITTVGPQEHWNWNTRGLAAGPPVKFPNVPTSLAESELYVEAPDKWAF